MWPEPAHRPTLEVSAVPTSFGFLSTYPPTQCGLATFTASLRAEAATAGHRTGVVRVLEVDEPVSVPDVVGHLVHGQAAAGARAARLLDAYDVAVVQHEFGIYGGPDGDGVLDVLCRLQVPSIVVVHTVLVDPTPHQRAVLEAVARWAGALVTMTATARRRLVEHYDVDDAKVVVIPHGAPAALPERGRPDREPPLLLTWGLLGPGKGIERVIDALPSLRDLRPRPRYLVVGDTHPRVLEREGERYRDGLVARAARLGVADMVTFQAGYLEVAGLRALAARADVVVLPYDSREQVTSGVLIEAVAARRPVVATAFAHAVELLGSGTGIVVDHDDPDAMGVALRRVLEQPALAAAMHERASLLAPELTWSAVGRRYVALATSICAAGATAVA